MASRYATLLRSVRPAFNSGGNSFRAAGGRAAPSTPRRSFSNFRNPIGYDSARFRRHCAKSLIPLHDAVAAAKLISHLSVSSRSRSALSLGRLWKPVLFLGAIVGLMVKDGITDAVQLMTTILMDHIPQSANFC
eukprot:Gb_18031 [translate_table: standard]